MNAHHRPPNWLSGPLAKRIVVPPKPAGTLYPEMNEGRSYLKPVGQCARTLFAKPVHQGGGKSGTPLFRAN